jgi:hypothetical protein
LPGPHQPTGTHKSNPWQTAKVCSTAKAPTIFIHAGNYGLDVVGEKPSTVQHQRQHLGHGIHRHVFGMGTGVPAHTATTAALGHNRRSPTAPNHHHLLLLRFHAGLQQLVQRRGVGETAPGGDDALACPAQTSRCNTQPMRMENPEQGSVRSICAGQTYSFVARVTSRLRTEYPVVSRVSAAMMTKSEPAMAKQVLHNKPHGQAHPRGQGPADRKSTLRTHPPLPSYGLNLRSNPASKGPTACSRKEIGTVPSDVAIAGPSLFGPRQDCNAKGRV